jgi:hypothetical protein
MRGSLADYDLQIELQEKVTNSDGDECWGTCAQNRTLNGIQIELDQALRGKALVSTLLHELLHAVSDIGGMDLSHSKVYVMSSLLTQALTTSGILDPYHIEVRMLLSKLAEKKSVGPPKKAVV